jgi:hypothetical protein
MPKKDLLSLWYEALNAPHDGLAVKTDDREYLRQNLYAARVGYDEIGKEVLAITFPLDPEDELHIVKKRGKYG